MVAVGLEALRSVPHPAGRQTGAVQPCSQCCFLLCVREPLSGATMPAVPRLAVRCTAAQLTAVRERCAGGG